MSDTTSPAASPRDTEPVSGDDPRKHGGAAVPPELLAPALQALRLFNPGLSDDELIARFLSAHTPEPSPPSSSPELGEGKGKGKRSSPPLRRDSGTSMKLLKTSDSIAEQFGNRVEKIWAAQIKNFKTYVRTFSGSTDPDALGFWPC